jgi:hypothetical protein
VRLLEAWRRLTEQGAVVHRPPRLDRLDPTELGALAEDQERRLRALAEGRAAGWVPRDDDA